MSGRLLLLLLAGIGLSGPAWACRCAPQGLAAHYARADEVVIARLQKVTAAADGQYAIWELEAPNAHHKPATDIVPRGRLRYRTARSSASCGLAPAIGASYVLFAQDAGGLPLVDSCSGSRMLFDAAGTPGQGFSDVPLRFVPGQLNGLAGAAVLAAAVAQAPRPDDPANARMIGLLDLKTLSHGGPATLRRQPAVDAAVLHQVRDYAEVRAREVGYEQRAAVVYARAAGWSRLQLADGRFGWLAPEEAGTFFPYPGLPVRRLAYLTGAWSGFVWPQPGAGLPFRHRPEGRALERRQFPANVLESRELAGQPWFRIQLLASDGCDGAEARDRGGGWIPAYGAGGEPTAWYHSRGC